MKQVNEVKCDENTTPLHIQYSIVYVCSYIVRKIYYITNITLTIPLGPSECALHRSIATAPIKEDYTTKLMVIDKHPLYEHNNSHILNLR